MLNRFATLAAFCVLIPFGTAPVASADPPPDNGAVRSGPSGVLDAPDGCVLTVVGGEESEVPVAPLNTASTSRGYRVSGTFTGSVQCGGS